MSLQFLRRSVYGLSLLLLAVFLAGNALKILRTAGQDDKMSAEISTIRGDAYLAMRDFDAAADKLAIGSGWTVKHFEEFNLRKEKSE